MYKDYSDFAGIRQMNPENSREGVWKYYKGQKMRTYLWIRESFLNAIQWMKDNPTSVAASGSVCYQFMVILQRE
jgi:hypothetical protein